MHACVLMSELVLVAKPVLDPQAMLFEVVTHGGPENFSAAIWETAS